MSKKFSTFGVIKEGKTLQAKYSCKKINDFSPHIIGNCKIDDNGIAIGYGNFKISTIGNQNKNLRCFSFMFIRLSSEPKIEFGLESQSKKLIQFDFASFLYSIRSEHIKPQISFDGIDVSIRMFVENSTLFIYMNDVKLSYSQPADFDSYSFFIDIKNDPNSPTILATPFHNVTPHANNRDNFLSFFPKLINHFWCSNEKYLYSEIDNYVAPARTDKLYSLISDEIPQLPGSNLIYFELVITYINSDCRFKVGFTNHEITHNSSNSRAFDSIPYFSYPDKQLLFGKNCCYVITENITLGTIIGFGIQKPGNNNKKSKSTDKKIDENAFIIINGNEYRFTYSPIDDQNQKNKKRFNMHKHYYSFLSTSCVNFHCMFNLGQKRFQYMDYLVSNYNTKLPPGWSIYSPFFPNKWIKGVPDRHVLNMFCPPNYSKKSYFGISYTEKISLNGCYEVTALELEKGLIKGMPTHKKGDEVIAIGFSHLDYYIDQLVGWQNNSYGIQSDDGSVYLSDGQGSNYGKQCKIETGTNVLTQIDQGNLSFTINGTRIETNHQITSNVYPAISYQASPCFIVNFGDSPFYNQPTLSSSLNENKNESEKTTTKNTKINKEKENTNNDTINENNDTINNNNNNNINNESTSNDTTNEKENETNNNNDDTSNDNENNKNNDDNITDSVLTSNLEIYKLSNKRNDQLTLDGISYRVTLFNKLIVMMNTKELIKFNLEVGDLIESRDRCFRGTIAGALNGRLYCYIEKYEGAFPLVETTPLDVALTYRVLKRENKKFSYPIILYNTLTEVDVSKGSFEDLYPTESGLSFFIGVTKRHEFVFRPLVDFYNNETLFSLSSMPDSIIPRRSKPKLLPLLTNSDSQTRFFVSNENLLNHQFETENQNETEIETKTKIQKETTIFNNTNKNHSNFKIKNNIKLLDIVKILDDNYDYNSLVKQRRNSDIENDTNTNTANSENSQSSPLAPRTENNNENNINRSNDRFDRRAFYNAWNVVGDDSINNYDDDSRSSSSSNSNNNNNRHGGNNNNFRGYGVLYDNDIESIESDDNNIILKNNDWSRIKNCALIVGKKGKDIVAWDGKELLLILPTHAKIIMEPFYPFGSHRSFHELKRVSTGLFPGGIRYPTFYHGFCGSHFIVKIHKEKRYFQSYGGCKMPPLMYQFANSLNEKKKNVLQFHHIKKINYDSLPPELLYEVDEKSEKGGEIENKKAKLITDSVFNGGPLYSSKK